MFIAFDGLDGVGKSSQVSALTNLLLSYNLSVNNYDMGHEGFFDDIFTQIKNKELLCSAEIRELIYYFEGVLFGNKIVTPLLSDNHSIGIVDRYLLSFMSYGPLNGMPKETILKLTDSIPWPDLYFFIDVTPEITLQRIQKYRKIDLPEIGYKNSLSNNDEENAHKFLVHQTKVYENYIQAINYYESIGRSVIRIDGTLPPSQITSLICSEVLKKL